MNREKLLAYMEKNGIDGFFIAKKENVRYISGYTGWDSYLLITRGTSYFIKMCIRDSAEAAAEDVRRPGRLRPVSALQKAENIPGHDIGGRAGGDHHMGRGPVSGHTL